MNSRRIVWLSLLAVTFIFFFFLFPVHIYDRHPFLFGFLGGGLIFIFLFQALADFQSLYELTEKAEPGEEVSDGRKLAPFAVIPSIIIVFVLFFYHAEEKEKELYKDGVLSKGTVVDGESSTTRRRFQTNTSYSITVSYTDSLNRPHILKTSINGGDFQNMYKGAVIDLLYSRKHPSLAKVILDSEDLAKVKSIPQGKITIDQLIDIFEGKIKEDSLLSYLNSINYEWTTGQEKGVYQNDKLNMAIRYFPEEHEMVFLQKTNYMRQGEGDFERNFDKKGFKKKATRVDGKVSEFYYNDKYLISKEVKSSERTDYSHPVAALRVFEVFHIVQNDSLVKNSFRQ